MPLDELFAEANRQLTICNACRYCEGYCPVWPALERRQTLEVGDVTHLANLCHDCNDCFTACMYTAPHEFALNPPQIFTKLRSATYDQYIWPQVPESRRTRVLIGLLVGLLAIVLLVSLRYVLHPTAPAGSPYGFIPHSVLITIVLIPVAWGLVVMTVAALRYWHDIGACWRELMHPFTWVEALSEGARLKHLSGGGGGCDYPEDAPNNQRKFFHLTLVTGFGLCFASTITAAIEEEMLHRAPPYPIISAPVLLGLIGGAGMIIGCAGLLTLQGRRDHRLTTTRMSRADQSLTWTLILLAVTGTLTTAFRSTEVFTPMLAIHLTTVVTCFAIAPYTKFAHFVYRTMSIYKDRLETVAEARHAKTRHTLPIEPCVILVDQRSIIGARKGS